VLCCIGEMYGYRIGGPGQTSPSEDQVRLVQCRSRRFNGQSATEFPCWVVDCLPTGAFGQAIADVCKGAALCSKVRGVRATGGVASSDGSGCCGEQQECTADVSPGSVALSGFSQLHSAVPQHLAGEVVGESTILPRMEATPGSATDVGASADIACMSHAAAFPSKEIGKTTATRISVKYFTMLQTRKER
jgi:hypothetical protein